MKLYKIIIIYFILNSNSIIALRTIMGNLSLVFTATWNNEEYTTCSKKLNT